MVMAVVAQPILEKGLPDGPMVMFAQRLSFYLKLGTARDTGLAPVDKY